VGWKDPIARFRLKSVSAKMRPCNNLAQNLCVPAPDGLLADRKRQRGVRHPAGTAGDITTVSATVILREDMEALRKILKAGRN
jgi:hypothetical protein